MPDTTRHAAEASGFADVICADADWLRAEFEAIVAANFGVLPPSPPGPRSAPVSPRRSGCAARAASSDVCLVGALLARLGERRQRSPPLVGRVPIAQ